jgi:hypothetical protein
LAIYTDPNNNSDIEIISYNNIVIDTFCGGSGTGKTYFYGIVCFSGNIGINTQTPAYTLDVSGDIYASGTITAPTITQTSDYRTKSNVKTLPKNYTVDNLRPVSYFNNLSNTNDIGFIAHEVQSEYPDLVIGEVDGEQYQTLKYNGLIAIAINEIKTLKEENTTLKEENAILKEKITNLEEKMELIFKSLNL